MLSDRGDSRLEPIVVHLDEVLEDIAAGVVRVPAFQRPFVWRPEQMLDLFDSIERTYPIGSVLLWETTEPVQSLSQVGEVEVPDVPSGQTVSYVLDGHQRLSTLFGVLRRLGRPPRADDQREWKWRIYRDLMPKSDSDRYRHHRAAGSPPAPPPDHFLPVRSVASTLDFLEFSRKLELRVGRERSERLVREADRVAQRIKSYKLTLIKLKGADLSQAVEVYTRLNRTGTRMDADQMVSALTHRSTQPPLASRVDDIVGSIAATGFGELPRLAVFRAVLAVAGEPDIMSPRWETVAKNLQNRLHDAVPATEQAVGGAVEFLRDEVKLPLARLLPYSHQLVLLAAFFRHCPKPTEFQRHELRRWFWATSWSSAFAGATSTVVRRALQEMRDFAELRGPLSVNLAGVQPMPDTFNLNSARTLAYVAWEAGEFPRRRDALGQEFDVVERLASGLTQAYRPVVVKDRRPANRLVFPTVAGYSVEQTLRDLPVAGGLFGDDESQYGTAGARKILESHGICVKSWQRLREGHGKLFVDDRTEFLEGRLRAFAAEIGVQLGDQIEGVADDDTE